MDTPITRLADEIRRANAAGDTLEAIAKRAGIDDWQNVQNIANGTVTQQSKYFIPICAALGLNPVKIWYGDKTGPFDPDMVAIMNELLSWSPSRRAAHRESLGIPPLRPKGPGKRPKAKSAA